MPGYFVAGIDAVVGLGSGRAVRRAWGREDQVAGGEYPHRRKDLKILSEVAAGSHEEQHGNREHEIHTGGQ